MAKRLSFASGRSAIIFVEQRPQETWYSQEDYLSFEQAAVSEANRINRLLAAGRRLNEEDFYECIGIERYLSPAVLEERLTGQRKHLNLILVSQRFWREQALGQLSEMRTERSRNWAHEIALSYIQLSSDTCAAAGSEN